jgi:hypothetical protein
MWVQERARTTAAGSSSSRGCGRWATRWPTAAAERERSPAVGSEKMHLYEQKELEDAALNKATDYRVE